MIDMRHDNNIQKTQRAPSRMQNKQLSCYDGAHCHRRPFKIGGPDKCWCTDPADCTIDISKDGKQITVRGRNAVCLTKGTPGVVVFVVCDQVTKVLANFCC